MVSLPLLLVVVVVTLELGKVLLPDEIGVVERRRGVFFGFARLLKTKRQNL